MRQAWRGLLLLLLVGAGSVFLARSSRTTAPVISNSSAPPRPAVSENADVVVSNPTPSKLIDITEGPGRLGSGVRTVLVAKTVRVAAIQCAPRMGKVGFNRTLLTDLINRAAAQGAKIVVLPECALQGYMNPPQNRKWSKESEPEDGDLSVGLVAENVPGPSTRYFSGLARQLKIYLALPLIESDGDAYFNSIVLFDPLGRIAAKHRKQELWPPGDASWASEGRGPAVTLATPYGTLGLMICYDVHGMPKKLKAAGAEIVLYAVGWYGPTEVFFGELFPRRYVAPNGFAVVAANWSGELNETEWDGLGSSCIIDRNGVVVASARTKSGPELVIADLPVGLSALAGQTRVDDKLPEDE